MKKEKAKKLELEIVELESRLTPNFEGGSAGTGRSSEGAEC